MSKLIKNFIKTHTHEVLAFAVLLVAYAPVFSWMWERWFARDSYYSHGILVPFISLFLIWQMRQELSSVEKKSSPWGITLLIAGSLIYLICALLRIGFASGFSLLIVLAGLILHFWGGKVFKKIAFPFFFLIFMIPLPEVVIVNISFRMKMFAAQIATYLLNHIGIPARRFGSIIAMRHSQVVVEDVCSGLRSLVSLTALGSIFAFWFKDKMFKRILLFLSTIPIAVITNVCRVVLLSVVSEVWGAKYIHGMIHDASGFLLFGLAFVLLLSMKKMLE